MTVIFSDALLDIRAWLRADPDMRAFHSGRVFYRIPDNPSGYPLLRLYRVGGGTSATSEVPEQTIRIGLEVWGAVNSDYSKVRQLVTAIESSFHQASNLVVGGTLIQNASIQGSIDSPDPDTGCPRFIITGLVNLRAA